MLRSRVDVAVLQRAQVEFALEAKVHVLAQVSKRIPFLETALAQSDSQIVNLWAEAQVVLAQFMEATCLADLASTRDKELRPALIRGICERFVQTMHMQQLFYR